MATARAIDELPSPPGLIEELAAMSGRTRHVSLSSHDEVE